MSCRRFETTGYLYLSDELIASERKAYKRHLKTCPNCQQQLAEASALWKQIADIPLERPDPTVRNAILDRARAAPKKKGIKRIFDAVGDLFFFHPRLTYGVSIAAAVVIMIFIVISPMLESREDVFQSAGLEWQDTFLAEADYLDKELDRLESGVLLANYSTSDEGSSEDDDWLSPMSQDLNWIRSKVENLVKTIYGI